MNTRLSRGKLASMLIASIAIAALLGLPEGLLAQSSDKPIGSRNTADMFRALEELNREIDKSPIFAPRTQSEEPSKPAVEVDDQNNLASEIATLTIKGDASSLAFSSDDKLMASGNADGTVKLWNPQTGKLIRTLPEAGTLTGTLERHGDNVNYVAFSSDGKLLVSSGGGEIKIWDSQSGKMIRTLEHRGHSLHVALSPDGQRLASSNFYYTSMNDALSILHKNVTLWDVKTGKVKLSLDGSQGALAFSPDGATLASANESEIRLRDVRTGNLKGKLKRDGYHDYKCVAYSPDGKTLASGGCDDTIELWDAQTGTLKRSLKGGDGVVFSPDGRILAVCGTATPPFPSQADVLNHGTVGAVMLWDAQTGNLIQKLSFKRDSGILYAEIPSIAYSPSGNLLAWVDGGDLKLWDVSQTTRNSNRENGSLSSSLPPATQPTDRGSLNSNPEKVRGDPGTLQSFSPATGQRLLFDVTGSADGSIWGTDVYTNDSLLAAAAVHAGALKDGERGIVQVTILSGQSSYEGSRRNGAESDSYGEWDSSYRVARFKH